MHPDLLYVHVLVHIFNSDANTNCNFFQRITAGIFFNTLGEPLRDRQLYVYLCSFLLFNLLCTGCIKLCYGHQLVRDHEFLSCE